MACRRRRGRRTFALDMIMATERKRIDTESIRYTIDLVEFAARYTNLKRISARGVGEYAGPCPCCGGHDRFHVKGDHFYCRQCYPRGGDVINLVQWIHGVSFLEACQMLTAGDFSFSEKPDVGSHVSMAGDVERLAGWCSATYQESARKTMMATHKLLLGREGLSGRAYLLSRGLSEATWQSYRLGYGRTFHPTRGKNMEAIFIPWLGEDGKTITAIQHRFLDPSLEKGERYVLKPGSEPILFGLPAFAPCCAAAPPLGAAQRLVIVEGELNAMSLHQIGMQALSVGSESNVGNVKALSILQERLPDYEQVIVWFDKPEYGQHFADLLAEAGLFRKEKIHILAHELDANEWLQRGELRRFLGKESS